MLAKGLRDFVFTNSKNFDLHWYFEDKIFIRMGECNAFPRQVALMSFKYNESNLQNPKPLNIICEKIISKRILEIFTLQNKCFKGN